MQMVGCPAEGSMPLKLQGVEWVRKVWSLYLTPLSPSVIHSCTLSCLLLFLSRCFLFLSFISFPSGAPSLSALLKLCTQTDRQTDRQTDNTTQAGQPYGLFLELCRRELFFLSALLLKPSLCPPLTSALCFLSLLSSLRSPHSSVFLCHLLPLPRGPLLYSSPHSSLLASK